jgi:hypothetical protein
MLPHSQREQVSAHSFDFFVTNLSTGVYTVTTSWKDTTAGTGISQSLACVGPLTDHHPMIII